MEKKDETSEGTKDSKPLEQFDGADEEVSVPEDAVKISPNRDEIEDAEIIDDEDETPEGPEDTEEEDETPAPEAKEVTMTREDLVAKGVLPPNGPPKRRPLVDAIHEEVTGEQPPEIPPAQNQINEDFQAQIHQHHSQQGSIALDIIKAMLSNGAVSAKTTPEKLVKRAYEITDELQATLDKRHKDALMEEFARLNTNV